MMDVSITGKIVETKLTNNSKGELITDVFISQGARIAKCRFKGNVTEKYKDGMTSTITGRIFNYLNRYQQPTYMISVFES